MRAYRLQQPDKSNYAKHLLEHTHSLTQTPEIEIIHICDKKQDLDFLEELEIKRHLIDPQYKVVNEQLNLGSSPLLDCLL